MDADLVRAARYRETFGAVQRRREGREEGGMLLRRSAERTDPCHASARRSRIRALAHTYSARCWKRR